jgi:hypothetical protein
MSQTNKCWTLKCHGTGEFSKIETDLPNIIKIGAINLIRETSNTGLFDPNGMSEKFREEIGSNRALIVGNGLLNNGYFLKNYISLKIGRIHAMNSLIKPLNDERMAIFGKLSKFVDQGINKKLWNDMFSAWNLLWYLTDDSSDMCERLLDKNILDYFV